MALQRSLIRAAKASLMSLLLIVLFDLFVLIYFEAFTIPYVSPAVTYLGDAISPFTPLVDPVLVYINLTTWLHPATTAYRSQTRRRYVTSVICHCMSAVALLAAILVKFSWFVESVYGFETNSGMCVGPCWKVWTELALIPLVVLAVFMGWELDGGLCARYLDRQVERQLRKEAEAAAERDVEKMKMRIDDEESAAGTDEPIQV